MPTKTKPLIRLAWSEKDRSAMVETQDQDRFIMAIEDVIEACRVYTKNNRSAFQAQFRRLLGERLGTWAHQHRDALERAFVTVRDSQLLFLVVTKDQRYNAGLEKDLTKLDLEIAHDDALSEVRLSVQSLPSCSERGYKSFCDPGVIFEYKGFHAE